MSCRIWKLDAKDSVSLDHVVENSACEEDVAYDFLACGSKILAGEVAARH